LGNYLSRLYGSIAKDVNQTRRFYRDVIGLKPIEEETGDSGPHFDLGTIRLTLLPREADGAHRQKNNGGEKPAEAQHLVFLVESSIEADYRDLIKRGVR
jgi:catechol 2,3-dioxygenase-like lactoylglutathione lyase family enzyme